MSVSIRKFIHFYLNDQLVILDNVAADHTLLDFLRLDRQMRGTKEGCAEGDCGACTVLVGRLLNGELYYESVNACIRFVGSLDGCHVVTVEAVKSPTGGLHIVQQAMVDTHASQCGFCTPGFVMSLYGLWMQETAPSVARIEKALQGNLCRCTGYAAIIRAAESVVLSGDLNGDLLVKHRADMIEKLSGLKDGCRVEVEADGQQIIIPANVDDLAIVLEENPNAVLVAGSTDVGLWVTKFMRPITPAVFIGGLEELCQVSADADHIRLGSGVTYSALYPLIVQHFPQLREFWNRIGGEQVRNMGTIGGNIANGSPIGDTPPALIALQASIILRKNTSRRKVLLENYFIEYGKQDRERSEFVEAIEIPKLSVNSHYAVYKITKRMDEDISAVCGGFSVQLDADGRVKNAIFAYGGMAGTPKRAAQAEAAVLGEMWDEAAIEVAIATLPQDFTPLSDWRASADYRLLAAQNLLRRFYLETTGEAELRLRREAVA
ncbi:xanthine dehydrogenase small subunit [Paenochrobactrum pullorum]|uniref:xanthine dehydrogenase small subunit n=1 Tax=Paenochrobactrum pullorum TaxID=1324351 RepID=UPI0035BC75C9